MNILKYKKPLIFYLCFLILFLTMGIFMFGTFGESSSFTFGIPDGMVYLISSIAMFLTPVLGVLFGYLLGPAFLWIHKKVFGKRMDYYVEEKEKPEKMKLKKRRLFFPALLAVNICIILSSNTTVQSALLVVDVLDDSMSSIFLMSLLLPFGIVIATALFTPAFALDEGGIAYSNRKKASGTGRTTELRSVGNWYLLLLKGYASISTLLNFYDLISSGLEAMSQPGAGPWSMMGTIVWPIMPFILMVLLIPYDLILNAHYDKNRIFMKKWTEKFKISKTLDEIATFKE